MRIEEKIKSVVRRQDEGVEYMDLVQRLNAEASVVGDTVEKLVSDGELTYTSEWKVVLRK